MLGTKTKKKCFEIGAFASELRGHFIMYVIPKLTFRIEYLFMNKILIRNDIPYYVEIIYKFNNEKKTCWGSLS